MDVLCLFDVRSIRCLRLINNYLAVFAAYIVHNGDCRKRCFIALSLSSSKILVIRVFQMFGFETNVFEIIMKATKFANDWRSIEIGQFIFP